MTMPVPTKKVVSVDALHLDELGYGPQGQHTRRAWQAECLENLLAGKAQFEAWQECAKSQFLYDLPLVRFNWKLIFDDGSSEEVLDFKYSSCDLDFVCQQFDLMLDAKDFNFIQSAHFAGAKFKNEADFSDAKFTRYSEFTSATFAGQADFKGAKFKGVSGFKCATFTKDALFHDAMFMEHTVFTDATFMWVASFAGATFEDVKLGASFSTVKFKGNVFFYDATFTGYVDFNSATFTGYADFNSATFKGYADFNSATFGGNAVFSGATFGVYAAFRLATFNQQCRFDNTFDEETQQWSNATTFAAGADFENATFKNVGHFERVNFSGQIPSFLGVDTSSTRLEFSDDTHFAWHDATKDAVERLGHLKRLADEHGQIDQALTFNALELHAKAAQPTASFANKLVTGAYALFSNYGRSFGLPIFWLGFILWLSFLFALGNYNQYKNIVPNVQCANLEQNITISKPRAAFEYAMFRASGVLDFTDADKQNHAVNCQLFKQPIEPWWMRAWGIFKAIASLGLLFLAALGLRNNYRIK